MPSCPYLKRRKDMKELTINDLWKLCVSERKKGNGGKKILISNDDEGNGFHGLFYGFTPTVTADTNLNYFEESCAICPVNSNEVEDYIILG